MNNVDKTFIRLKYPDSHKWRDKATIRNGYWPDGSIVRLSDPELQPEMDEFNKKLVDDSEFRKEFLRKIFPDEPK